MDYVTFNDVLDTIGEKNRSSVKKHLASVGIRQFADFDRWHMSRLATEIKETMAPSSAHTTFAIIKSLIGKYQEDCRNLPDGWRKILECKNEIPMKTYLTKEEVEAFGDAYVDSATEQTVRDGFYVSCKTGLRHSDLVKLVPSNFQPREEGGYYLNYVSKKTRIQASIVCSERTKEKVDWLHTKGVRNLSLVRYNAIVRILAQRAGIDTEVSVFKAGQELSGPKWKFLSSHSARVSFCTIVADLGTGILDIMQMAGHSNPAQTSRYIVHHEVKINPKVEQFLM